MQNVKETLCWSCQNAYAHKCRWIRRCQPVDGWVAESTKIRMDTDDAQCTVRSYLVHSCPDYLSDRAYREKTICPVCRTLFVKSNPNHRYCSTHCRELARLHTLMRGASRRCTGRNDENLSGSAQNARLEKPQGNFRL